MRFKKILMIGYSKGDLGEIQEDRLADLGQEIVRLPNDSSNITKHLSTTDCLLVRLGAGVDKEMIDNAPNLKYIGMLGNYSEFPSNYVIASVAKQSLEIATAAS